MRLTLFDTSEQLVAAWSREFGERDEVAVVHMPLEDLSPHDVLVSPANSFGIMDGGIDLAIRELLPGLQERVSAAVAAQWYGEQPPGTSMIVATGHDRFPHLAHTPTMRVPRPISDREVVYDCMRSMTLAVLGSVGREATIACPGLGTATGRVPHEAAARMMRLGWESILGGPVEITGWAAAGRRVSSIHA